MSINSHSEAVQSQYIPAETYQALKRCLLLWKEESLDERRTSTHFPSFNGHDISIVFETAVRYIVIALKNVSHDPKIFFARLNELRANLQAEKILSPEQQQNLFDVLVLHSMRVIPALEAETEKNNEKLMGSLQIRTRHEHPEVHGVSMPILQTLIQELRMNASYLVIDREGFENWHRESRASR